ncbi:MAG: tetratricopeptide repeat protein [Verrucomicrobiota bacterium]|jgi:tetratricopeptide (TPR) repeat protein
MKRLVVFVSFVLALSLLQARAQQNPDDQYIIVYALMQQADTLENSGDLHQALADYVEARNELEKFQKVFPDWDPKIVNFRLDYLAEKIAGVTARLPAVPQSVTPLSAAPVPAPPVAAASATAGLESQLSALRGQVEQLQADNGTLQAKLKEAMAVQPAAVDPREVAQIREQLRFLMKENDLLKVSLAQGHGGTPVGVDAKSFEELQQALAGAKQKLADQTARADKLALENQAFQTRMQSLLAGADASGALREENELLKKEVAVLKATPPASLESGGANSELAKARAQIARLQSASEVNSLEKTALEDRVRRLQTAAVPGRNENGARIHELERERDDLLAKLGKADKKLNERKGRDAAAQIEALARQVDALRARLTVDEAQAIPYTPEELALFKQSAPELPANPVAGNKSIRELPNGSASLVAEAQNYFSAKQYDKAGDDYREILRRDENNPPALANLAIIELEQNKLDDAERHIQQALAQSPNDAYSLMVLGRVEFSQKKYDEALDVLSRAAKLDPQNPDIENYLGVTLAQKGLRAQAETALRKAIQINPNYSAAHNNLAVIYISHQPPLVELARWHYQKALDGGQPRNPDLEKLLDEKTAPANSQ